MRTLKGKGGRTVYPRNRAVIVSIVIAATAIVALLLLLVGIPRASVLPFRVDFALEEALGIIRAVTKWEGAPRELRSVGQKILNLQPPLVAYSPPIGREWTYCQNHPNKDSIAAYIEPGENSIYVCQSTLERDWVKMPQLVQTLVHELIHLAGVQDECETMNLEFAFIKAYGREPAYKSIYATRCGQARESR